MELISGVTQNYAWGSHSLLARMRGEADSRAPEAELWFGAHPAGPSVLESGATLLDEIDRDPVGVLGHSIVDRFGRRLPFLLKLLAADLPLSIQAHPSIEQARVGFAREEAAGIAANASNRSFRDENHKPELIAALTPFEALIGFRDPAQTAALLHDLGVDAPRRIVDGLHAEGPKRVVEMLLEPSSNGLGELEVDALSLAIGDAGRAYGGGDWVAEADALARIDSCWRGDPGVAVAALLNHVVLQPGEAAYLDAGTLHSYVGGLAVEIMANSDNVVRGGLTPKHIDVATLLAIVRSETITPRPVPRDADGAYLAPAPDFTLTRIAGGTDRHVAGPAVILAVDGTTAIDDPRRRIELRPTEAVWLGVDEMATMSGAGTAFLATVGAATTLVGG